MWILAMLHCHIASLQYLPRKTHIFFLHRKQNGILNKERKSPWSRLKKTHSCRIDTEWRHSQMKAQSNQHHLHYGLCVAPSIGLHNSYLIASEKDFPQWWYPREKKTQLTRGVHRYKNTPIIILCRLTIHAVRHD